MNILIVTQYFWPEGFLINGLAADLVERGHNVTVLTGSPNYPQGRFFDGYGFFNKSQEYRGVKVLRVPLLPRGRGGGLRLALNYASFAVAASIAGPFICKDRYDLIFVFEPSPITVGIPALVLKFLKSAPIMFWVQDLWPESLSATGAVSSKVVLDLTGKLVNLIYRNCDRILIQSRAFLDSVVQQGGHREKTVYFPNSAEALFETNIPTTTSVSLPQQGFKIVFAGNVGAAQDFGTIIAAAQQLQAYKDIHWIVVGDGRMREWAEKEVVDKELNDNVHFLGRYPLETMPAFFADADALLVTLKKDPIFSLTIPSKVQTYLACGKPVIAAIDGEGARIIEEARAGFTCPAEDPEAFAQAVLRMYTLSRTERERLARNGRVYYEANFARVMLLDRLNLWMNELTGARQGGTSL